MQIPGSRPRRRPQTLIRITAFAAAGVLVAALSPALTASAAPVRFEAENATVSQGLVESTHAGFSGTGFVNYDNAAGGYVEWTVPATAAGNATLTVRFANGSTTARPMDIAVNGTVVADEESFPATGAWTTWQSKTITAPVVAGENKIRVTGTGATGGPNVDYLDVEVESGGGPSTDYQAEDATMSQAAAEAVHPGFTGTGYANYENVAGGYVEWTVQAPSAGNLAFEIRYANGSTGNRPMDIALNGTVVVDELAFAPTGGWPTWGTVKFNAVVTAGENKIRATATTAGGGPNVDKLTASIGDNEAPTAPGNLRVVGEVRPTAVDLAWDPSTDNIAVASYRIFNGGNELKTVAGNITTVTVDNLTPQTRYVLHVLAVDSSGNPSQASNNVDITTPRNDDDQPPSTPGGLRTVNVTANSITLTWNASTDNTGVTGYNVYRDGTKFATVPDLTATADGLTPNTAYAFTVEAFDANGNTSPRSAALSARTSDQAVGGDPIFDRNVNTQVDLPWGIAFLPDGSALVAERDRFEIVQITLSGQKTVVGRITEARGTNGEGGLMGLAVSPDFATDRLVYAMHTADNDNRVVRFRFENGQIGPREAIVTGIARSRFHNGGRIKFGPDGFLYITTGDAQNDGNAQNLNSLNGKILRVTKTGAGAPGNPFPNAPRVYSLGHRNPQGLAWDRAGRLWSAEFGASSFDELNRIDAGKNYGWPQCQGRCNNPNFTNPVQQWGVAEASPSGLEIVGDFIYMAAVRGERLWVMRITGANSTDAPRAFFNGRWGRLRTVVKTPDGGLWLTSTNADKNGGTPNVLDNVIVRLRFAGGTQPGPFTLTSPAFNNNGNIPIRHTCQQDGAAGNDISPTLNWGAGPAGTASYAITLIDTANNNKHWVIWDIPATARTLPENLGGGFNVPGQTPAKQKALGGAGTNTKFFGPCPGGQNHRYEFRLYAVNTATLPGVGTGSNVAAVETAILANDLATSILAGNSNAST